WFLSDALLTRTEGWLLLLTLPCAMAFLVWSKRHHPEEIDEDIPTMSQRAAWLWFVIGLGILILSADLLVRGASELALAFGVSPLVIGLTVVAVGTSLPELAASVASVIKGHYEIAIGNVIGSNLFNLLAVMSIAAVIAPLSMEPAVFGRDYAAMAGITAVLVALLLLGFARHRHGSGVKLGRIAGAIFISLYIGYYVILLG
ncbi:MAG TPA: calcium/sodium antiporter, partial [Marinobacter sp.]|nr:calcium/sodium antiporter [Marinobacter sp.]